MSCAVLASPLAGCNGRDPPLVSDAPLRLDEACCLDATDPAALPVEEALRRILDAVVPLSAGECGQVPVTEALGRVLARDVFATISVPPHRNSAMDGYALAGSELPQGTAVRELAVLGTALAGHPFAGRLGPGQCVRVMTGAVMPEGADTVVPQEHVERCGGALIRLDGRTPAGANVRQAGEDVCVGQRVLARGRRLTAADLGLAASQGLAVLAVRRRLRVALLCTGDELRAPGETLAPGQIYDSNRYVLTGLLRRHPVEVTDLGRVLDDPQALRLVLEKAARQHDMILTTGGVSVGETDHVRRVLEELGGVESWKVAMKPGRPLAFGRIGGGEGALLFGLPGNPVAVMVTFGVLVEPALRRLAGEESEPALLFSAVTECAWRKRPGRTEYQRGMLKQAADGSLRVDKAGPQGSGVLHSMARANCLVVLPHESGPVRAGEIVRVRLLEGWL